MNGLVVTGGTRPDGLRVGRIIVEVSAATLAQLVGAVAAGDRPHLFVDLNATQLRELAAALDDFADKLAGAPDAKG